MATKQNRPTAGDAIRGTISTFELNQELREKKRREKFQAPAKPKPDTFKVRKVKKIIT